MMKKAMCTVLLAATALFVTVAPAHAYGNGSLADNTNAADDGGKATAVVDSSLHIVGQLVNPTGKSPLTIKSAILPVAMITYGALGLIHANSMEHSINTFCKSEISDNGVNKPFHIDNFTLIAPALAVYGLNAAGIKGRHNLVDRSILLGMSNLISNTVVFSLKNLAHINRPDGSNCQSFPSGHTAEAFVSAEFMRQEYKDVSPWYGAAGYAVAIATGTLRMYNNKHWFNDVVAGAGIGILSTRFTYWLYPKLKNTLFHNCKSTAMIAPTYSNGAVGVAAQYSFR